jgi:tetratricopeptide (TPR) repeat protein
VSLNLGRKKGHVRVACKKVNEIVPDYIWQEVSNGRAQPVVTTPSQSNDTANFADAWASYSCDELNDVSYIAYLKQDYETALEAGKAALKVAKTNKQRGAATYNIGITYFAMEKYEKAVHYLRLSLAVNKTRDAEDALQQAIQKRNQRRTNYGIGTGLVLGLGAIGFRRIKKGRSK